MPDFGDGSPREDYGSRDPMAPSMSPEDWAVYQSKRKRDAILGILSVLGGTSALGALGGAFGGAAGASSQFGTAAGTGFGGAPFIGGAEGLGWVPGAAGVAGGAAGAAGGGAGAAGAGGGAGAAGAGGGALDAIKGILSAKDWVALLMGLAGTVGSVATSPKNNPNAPTTQTLDPALKNLVDLQSGRLQQQQPLYESILKLAMGLMPTAYQGAEVPGLKMPATGAPGLPTSNALPIPGAARYPTAETRGYGG